MKTAKATAQAVTIDCPNCREPMPTHEGDLVWDKVDLALAFGVAIRCNACSVTCEFPKAAMLSRPTTSQAPKADDYFDDPIGQKRVRHGSPR